MLGNPCPWTVGWEKLCPGIAGGREKWGSKIKRSKKMKTVIIGAFVAISGVCYSFFLPKEEVNVEITKGNAGVFAAMYTSTPVPTPTEKPVAGGEGTGVPASGTGGQENTGGTENAGGSGKNGGPGNTGESGNPGGSGSAEGSENPGGPGKTGGSADPGSLADRGSLVNINTAGSAELMTLPGIGESRAAWIIEYREKNGPFKKIEDIMKVKGIKEGIFAKIKDRISVE